MLGHIRRKRVGDIIPLTSPEFVRDRELWVADLRWEGSLERSVLVGTKPVRAFADEEGYLDFSRRVAAVRGRVAIADAVAAHVMRPLESIFKSGVIDPDTVDEVRIRCTPSTVFAESVELFLLITDDADPGLTRDAVDAWYTAVAQKLPEGLTFVGASVHFTSEFTRSMELGTERVNFDDLTASG